MALSVSMVQICAFIHKYRSLNSTMFLCFLDVSKAFDRVNHTKLFEKIVLRGTPGYLVRILIFCYSHQSMVARWGDTMSEPFQVSNCVHQEGNCPLTYLIFIWMTCQKG